MHIINDLLFFLFFLLVNFDHFEILRAIGKGSFGKVSIDNTIDNNNFMNTVLDNCKQILLTCGPLVFAGSREDKIQIYIFDLNLYATIYRC